MITPTEALASFVLAQASGPSDLIASLAIGLMAAFTATFTNAILSLPAHQPIPAEMAYIAGLRDGQRSSGGYRRLDRC
jgi:hypothetical protein